MAKKTGLGKGLDALFSDNSYKKMEDPLDEEVVQQIKITEIEPNADQPRKKFDEDKLEELASSIKRYGVIQPIIVMPKDGYYQIVAGERRRAKLSIHLYCLMNDSLDKRHKPLTE